MEHPNNHGRPSSADDDGRPRRFPDPPPTPHARDADAFQEYAALVRRRDALLRELDTEHVRLRMIMRELMDTEYAMAARFAAAHQWLVPTVPWPQDRWHRREATLGDAPPHPPSTHSEHPTCCRPSPAAVRPPPVYPHVEQAPSPPVTMTGYMDYSRSLGKQTLTQEALLPGAANASVRPIGSDPVRQDVTPKHQDALGGERKADLEGDNGSRNNSSSSGHRKDAETPMVDFTNGPGCHSSRCEQAGPADVAVKKQKRLEISELAAEQPGSGNNTKQQQKCRSSGQRKVEDSTREDQINGLVQLPCEYIPADQGNAAYSEQKRIDLCKPRPGTDAKQQQECRSSGAKVHPMSGDSELSPSPRKQTPVEGTVVPAVANVITRPTSSMCFREEVTAHGQDIGEEPKVNVEDDHGVRPFYRNRNRSSSERNSVEPAMGAQVNKPLQQPSQSKLGDQEKLQKNAAYNEQKKVDIGKLTPERTSSALKRRLTVAAPLAKKQKPHGESSCTVNLTTRPCNQEELPSGRWHQSNAESLQARIKPAELNVKAMPGHQGNSARNWEPVRWDGEEDAVDNTGSEDAAASRWTCRICNARCTTASTWQEHLGGRRHRENKEAILAKFRTSYSRTDVDSEKTEYYCEVCGVRCPTDAILASHLIGRRHWNMLQGLE